ncbi:MAG: hypothetical protein F4Y11_02040 [Chloroflexi bacterium]|nr:hypothetical protein [Chloroflexota bacterium]
MTDEPMELCLQLMMADDSVEVVEILNRMGYWQDRSAWRHLGDTQNNWSTIGAQQSDPVAALAEKLVNSIDACLLGECQKREIDPRDPHLAPASPEEAIRTFFPGSDGITGKRGQIFVTVTKGDGRSSISVVDLGEGQKPCMFSETFMSLATGNKQSIPFVQG